MDQQIFCTPLNQVGFPRELVGWTNPEYPNGRRRIPKDVLEEMMRSGLLTQCDLVDADMEMLKKAEKECQSSTRS